jgi:hypothetical protein
MHEANKKCLVAASKIRREKYFCFKSKQYLFPYIYFFVNFCWILQSASISKENKKQPIHLRLFVIVELTDESESDLHDSLSLKLKFCLYLESLFAAIEIGLSL